MGPHVQFIPEAIQFLGDGKFALVHFGGDEFVLWLDEIDEATARDRTSNMIKDTWVSGPI